MCEDKQDPKQLDAARIAHRLLMLNMVSIPTTSFTMANTILDLYSSDPSRNFVDGLREECDRVLTGANGIWSKDAVSALHRVDSTIRESMRFSTFGIVALPRRVGEIFPRRASPAHTRLRSLRPKGSSWRTTLTSRKGPVSVSPCTRSTMIGSLTTTLLHSMRSVSPIPRRLYQSKMSMEEGGAMERARVMPNKERRRARPTRQSKIRGVKAM